jgi:hypothetical protein
MRVISVSVFGLRPLGCADAPAFLLVYVNRFRVNAAYSTQGGANRLLVSPPSVNGSSIAALQCVAACTRTAHERGFFHARVANRRRGGPGTGIGTSSRQRSTRT